jgi:hypothetical protein
MEILMKLKFILTWIISVAVIISLSVIIIKQKEKRLTDYVSSFQDMSYKTERGFIENIPVYRDFATPALVRELQTYNLAAHALEVVKHGIKPLKNTDDINTCIKDGRLIPLNTEGNNLFYFHNVQKEYRFLTPQCKAGLELVAERFQHKVQSHKPGLPVVKLAVSSVIRTVDYQEKIFGRKFVSAHSYGGCFDIFFDDYFVQLPAPGTGSRAEERLRKSLLNRSGYLLGDALREQFRTVLMETLLELQREKKIYVFLEEDNRCYHITVLVK